MFNRRRFIAVVGAVLAAPIAAVRALTSKKPQYVVGVDLAGEPDEAVICLMCYCGHCQKYTSHFYQLVGQPRRPSYIHLCDTCAEKEEYLCKRRHENGGGNYPCLCGLRGCSGIGPWLNEVSTYKPPQSHPLGGNLGAMQGPGLPWKLA